MKDGRVHRPLGHALWFKALLTLVIFAPPLAGVPYEQAHTPDVIAAVLAHPLAAAVPALLLAAKLLLLSAVLLPMLGHPAAGRLPVAYYGGVLLLVGMLQNMALTEQYGFVWLIGNSTAQLSVAAYCCYDLRQGLTVLRRVDLRRDRLWVFIPMIVAFLMPYAVNESGVITPALLPSVWNEAGVTYCMITPVILGVLLLFSRGVHKPLLSIISYVGMLFGLMNMATWFALRGADWWMGVLHLPLLVLSGYGLIVARREK